MSKKKCSVLTDDVYFFEGIQGLYLEDMELYHEYFAGNVLKTTFPATTAIIIIDARILLGEEWSGYSKLVNENPDAIIIWVYFRSVCRFIECETFFPGICATQNLHTFIMELKIRVNSKLELKIPFNLLTSYEKKLVPYFSDGVDFSVISKFFLCTEYELYVHRRRIMYKLGFRSALHIPVIFNRMPQILLDNIFHL